VCSSDLSPPPNTPQNHHYVPFDDNELLEQSSTPNQPPSASKNNTNKNTALKKEETGTNNQNNKPNKRSWWKLFAKLLVVCTIIAGLLAMLKWFPLDKFASWVQHHQDVGGVTFVLCLRCGLSCASLQRFLRCWQDFCSPCLWQSW